MGVLVAVLCVALFVGGIGIGLAISRRRAGAAGALPGVGAGGVEVPSSWARSHDPEARLHRRVRQVVTALGALPADGAAADVRLAVARAAAALDERLVAVAALPTRVKAEPLAHVTTEVEGLEAAVAEVTTRTAAGGDVQPALVALRQRLTLLDQARAELDAIDPTTPRAGPTPRPGPMDTP